MDLVVHSNTKEGGCHDLSPCNSPQIQGCLRDHSLDPCRKPILIVTTFGVSI
jgi:hypothetical protein